MYIEDSLIFIITIRGTPQQRVFPLTEESMPFPWWKYEYFGGVLLINGASLFSSLTVSGSLRMEMLCVFQWGRLLCRPFLTVGSTGGALSFYTLLEKFFVITIRWILMLEWPTDCEIYPNINTRPPTIHSVRTKRWNTTRNPFNQQIKISINGNQGLRGSNPLDALQTKAYLIPPRNTHISFIAKGRVVEATKAFRFKSE